MFLHTEKKNIIAREMLTKKNSCNSKIPHSPITFLMVRPIRSTSSAVLFNVLHVKILICRTSFVFIIIIIIIISDCYLRATVAFLLQCTFETKYSLFVSLFTLTTESVDEILYCNRSNESYWAVHSTGSEELLVLSMGGHYRDSKYFLLLATGSVNVQTIQGWKLSLHKACHPALVSNISFHSPKRKKDTMKIRHLFWMLFFIKNCQKKQIRSFLQSKRLVTLIMTLWGQVRCTWNENVLLLS